jgi:hypothetical protein
MKNIILSVSIQVGIILFGAIPAFAVNHDVNLTTIRQEANSSAKVKIIGLLSCKLGVENTGQGCMLKLEEKGTGRIYRLSNAGEAMRLFQSGSKNVAIEGKFSDAETIEIGNVAKI